MTMVVHGHAMVNPCIAMVKHGRAMVTHDAFMMNNGRLRMVVPRSCHV